MNLNKIFLILIFFIFWGCSTKSITPYTGGVCEVPRVINIKFSKEENNERIKKFPTLFDSIDKYIGTKKGGDCSGFITVLNKENGQIFWKNREFEKEFQKGRKSQGIYDYYKKRDLIYFHNPKIGDLIFFQNTLQSNKKRLNGEVSHIGVVREIYSDGRIRFVHNSRSKNINSYIHLGKRNVHKDGKKEINSYIVVCKKDDISCLASNRFIGFGRVE